MRIRYCSSQEKPLSISLRLGSPKNPRLLSVSLLFKNSIKQHEYNVIVLLECEKKNPLDEVKDWRSCFKLFISTCYCIIVLHYYFWHTLIKWKESFIFSASAFCVWSTSPIFTRPSPHIHVVNWFCDNKYIYHIQTFPRNDLLFDGILWKLFAVLIVSFNEKDVASAFNQEIFVFSYFPDSRKKILSIEKSLKMLYLIIWGELKSQNFTISPISSFHQQL